MVLMCKSLGSGRAFRNAHGVLYMAKRTCHLLQKADILICYEQIIYTAIRPYVDRSPHFPVVGAHCLLTCWPAHFWNDWLDSANGAQRVPFGFE